MKGPFSKVVSIVGAGSQFTFVALCEDGSLWSLEVMHGKIFWKLLSEQVEGQYT